MIVYEVTGESLIHKELGRFSFGLFSTEEKAQLEVKRAKTNPYHKLYWKDLSYSERIVYERKRAGNRPGEAGLPPLLGRPSEL